MQSILLLSLSSVIFMVQGDEGLIWGMESEVSNTKCAWVLLHLEGDLNPCPSVVTRVQWLVGDRTSIDVSQRLGSPLCPCHVG